MAAPVHHHRPQTFLERLAIPIAQSAVSIANNTRSFFAAVEYQPSFSKAYSCRPTLQNRFFLPPAATTEPEKKFPLVIHMHGGAWIINSPIGDDIYCADLARTSGVVVANINYRKAPQFKFPVGLDDCIAIAKAVIADSELPIDQSRIVLSGRSAGGNFCLVLAQMEEFRSICRGVLAWYPPVDFLTPLDIKMSHRPKTEKEDMLLRVYRPIQAAYLSEGDDRTNVRLHVTDAKRDDFPKHVFILGAEEDMLCWEAKVMAEKLAGNEEKKSLPNGWVTESGVLWELAEGQIHGFDQMAQTKAREAKRKEVIARVEDNITAWLAKVFA